MKKHIKLLNSNKGFSLLEILISVCVFAIVSVPIVSTFTGAAVVSKKTQQQVDTNSLRASIKESLMQNIKDNVSLIDYNNGGNVPIHNMPGTRPTPTRPPTISGPSTPASTPRVYLAGQEVSGVDYMRKSDPVQYLQGLGLDFTYKYIPNPNTGKNDLYLYDISEEEKHRYNLKHTCAGYTENVSSPSSSAMSSSSGAAARIDINLPRNLDPYIRAANKYQRLAIISLTDKTKTLTEYSFDATLLSDKVNTKKGSVDDKFKAKNTREYIIDVFRELPNGDREPFDSYTVNIFIDPKAPV